ncbi:hypothetical protein BDR22DRAFT_838284 [Usnea florida]
MSSKVPSDTSSPEPPSGSDRGYRHKTQFHPLCEALVLCADGTMRRDFFKLMKEKPIVNAHSHNEPRPDSRLHQCNNNPCEKFSLLQTSNHHLLYMAPGEEERMELNKWMGGFASGDVYLLKVKDPHGESLAYVPFGIPEEKPPAETKQFWAEIAAEIEIAIMARIRAATGLSNVITGLASAGLVKRD